MSNFEHPLSTGNGMLQYKEGQQLVIECIIILLRYMRRIEKTFDGIYKRHSPHCVIPSEN